MDEEYLINKIKELAPGEHYVPCGVLYTKLKISIQEDLSETLNALLKNKRLTYSKTLNDIMINVNGNG